MLFLWTLGDRRREGVRIRLAALERDGGELAVVDDVDEDIGEAERVSL